jgi:hypothetical protein
MRSYIHLSMVTFTLDQPATNSRAEATYFTVGAEGFMRGLHALCVSFTRPPRAIAAKPAQNLLAWFLLDNLD